MINGLEVKAQLMQLKRQLMEKTRSPVSENDPHHSTSGSETEIFLISELKAQHGIELNECTELVTSAVVSDDDTFSQATEVFTFPVKRELVNVETCAAEPPQSSNDPPVELPTQNRSERETVQPSPSTQTPAEAGRISPTPRDTQPTKHPGLTSSSGALKRVANKRSSPAPKKIPRQNVHHEMAPTIQPTISPTAVTVSRDNDSSLPVVQRRRKEAVDVRTDERIFETTTVPHPQVDNATDPPALMIDLASIRIEPLEYDEGSANSISKSNGQRSPQRKCFRCDQIFEDCSNYLQHIVTCQKLVRSSIGDGNQTDGNSAKVPERNNSTAAVAAISLPHLNATGIDSPKRAAEDTAEETSIFTSVTDRVRDAGYECFYCHKYFYEISGLNEHLALCSRSVLLNSSDGKSHDLEHTASDETYWIVLETTSNDNNESRSIISLSD